MPGPETPEGGFKATKLSAKQGINCNGYGSACLKKLNIKRPV